LQSFFSLEVERFFDVSGGRGKCYREALEENDPAKVPARLRLKQLRARPSGTYFVKTR